MMTSENTLSQRINTAQGKVRHEWYQNDNFVITSIFIKKVDPKTIAVDLQPRSLSVTIKLPSGSDYSLELDLAHDIDPKESTYDVLSTKVEVKLKKANVGLKWGVLEGEDSPVAMSTTNTNSTRPAYPSSSKKGPKNWDQLEKEVVKDDFDKPDGERALNALFQQIYKDASEETRRAMVKSYVESNGTCLSTNWEEVKKGKVETKPPEGLEVRKYDV